MTNPVLIEITRGDLVESVHRGAIAVFDDRGRQLTALGDLETPVFPRSSIKIMQALPLVESGTADAFGFGDKELALACASHNGEPAHVELARSMLRRAGLSETDLECGGHWPMGQHAANALIRDGRVPTGLHNNCSGKHAAMLAVARHLGEDYRGYIEPDHPMQQRLREIQVELTGVALHAGVCGRDGCSLPNWAMPLSSLATAFARMATGNGLSRDHATAARRLIEASMAEPFMVAGTGRDCTLMMQALGGRAYAKTGAEGVYTAAIPARGLGIALKIDDGTTRASAATIATLLSKLFPDAAEALGPLAHRQLHSWRGIHVGDLRPSEALAGLEIPA